MVDIIQMSTVDGWENTENLIAIIAIKYLRWYINSVTLLLQRPIYSLRLIHTNKSSTEYPPPDSIHQIQLIEGAPLNTTTLINY